MAGAPEGWRSTERWGPDGSVESEQRALARRPAVDRSEEGGRQLGRGYWLEVSRAAHGLVRVRERGEHVELRLLGLGPPLLVLGREQVTVEGGLVSCRYPILGGILSLRPGGSLTLTQLTGESTEFRIAVSGFFARLSTRRALSRWSGSLQRRLHVAVSRRYLTRLRAGAAS